MATGSFYISLKVVFSDKTKKPRLATDAMKLKLRRFESDIKILQNLKTATKKYLTIPQAQQVKANADLL